MSVRRCKAETPSSDFIKWKTVLDGKINEHNPVIDHLAQIVGAIVAANSAEKKPIEVKPYVLKYEKALPDQEEGEEDEAPFEERMKAAARQAKAAIGGMLGVNLADAGPGEIRPPGNPQSGDNHVRKRPPARDLGR